MEIDMMRHFTDPFGRPLKVVYGPDMSFTIEQLRSASDGDLITLHDQAAEHTVVGTAYFMDELHRRDQVRAIASSHKLAVASFWLTAVNSVVAVVAVIIAMLA
jgi:hypothetical protein